jgi:choline-sulfatase
VIKALEERGFMENTWIVYNSDHGDNLADHFLTQKVVFYESALKIPLIIRPPGGIPGWKSTALCDHLDVAASLIGMANGKPLEKSDGWSLVPQILAGEDSPRANEGKEVIFSEVVGYSMVFDGRYKLTVEAESQNPVEMFDLQKDTKELINCVNHPGYETVRQQLLENHLSKLRQRLDISALKDPKRTGDPIQSGNLLKRIEALKKEKYS